jgi:hypothetical protein
VTPDSPRQILPRVWLFGDESGNHPIVFDVEGEQRCPTPNGARRDEGIQQPEAVGEGEGGEVRPARSQSASVGQITARGCTSFSTACTSALLRHP